MYVHTYLEEIATATRQNVCMYVEYAKKKLVVCLYCSIEMYSMAGMKQQVLFKT